MGKQTDKEEKKTSHEGYSSEQLLHELGGCGRFQVILISLIYVTLLPAFFQYSLGTFSIYNPGWKCVGAGNMTSSNTSMTTSIPTSGYVTSKTNAGMTHNAHSAVGYNSNGTSEEVMMWKEYGRYSCVAYEKCPDVEFSPDANTMMTEWNLLCNRGWILSTALAIGNAGSLVSVIFVGYIGDRFGRRMPFVLSVFIMQLLSVGLYFSNSWKMYAGFLFVSGFAGSFESLVSVIMSEYVSPSWRIRMYCIPAGSVINMLFPVVAMAMPDWRALRLISIITGFVTLIPLAYYLPESLRWVSVKGSKDTLMDLISRISKTNKKPVPSVTDIESMVEINRQESNKATYSMFSLFRKGYRYPSFVMAVLNFSISLIYAAFHLGLATLPGNFYLNLFIYGVTEQPVNIAGFIFGNRYNRKPTMLFNFGMCALCIFTIVALDLTGSGGTYGITALVMVAKFFLAIGWIVLGTARVEIYPTVIRSTSISFGTLSSAIGGVVAPYLIPRDHSTFYITYLTMGVLVLVCTVLLMFFPETKGNRIKDTWEDGPDVVEVQTDNMMKSGDANTFTVQNSDKK